MVDKCLVMGCTNHQGEGRFVGELCAPCHTMLTQGKKTPSNAWFAKEWVGLADEEVSEYLADEWVGYSGYFSCFEEVMKWAEEKLKEKNA